MTGYAEHRLADAKRMLAYPPGFRRGIPQLIKPVQPAAGANFTYKISSDYWERLLTLAFTFTSGTNGFQRNISVALQDGDAYTFDQIGIVSGIQNAYASSFFGDLQPVSSSLAQSGLQGEGTQAAPAANTTIAFVTSTSGGTYSVTTIVTLSGTLAAGTDNNNIQLFNGGALSYGQLNNSIQLTPQTFGPTLITVPAGGTIAARNTLAGTAGSVYSVSIVANLVTGANQFTLPDLILPSGFQVAINVAGIQATDQISAIGLFVERYGSKYAHGGYEADEREFLYELAEREMSGGW